MKKPANKRAGLFGANILALAVAGLIAGSTTSCNSGDKHDDDMEHNGCEGEGGCSGEHGCEGEDGCDGENSCEGN